MSLGLTARSTATQLLRRIGAQGRPAIRGTRASGVAVASQGAPAAAGQLSRPSPSRPSGGAGGRGISVAPVQPTAELGLGRRPLPLVPEALEELARHTAGPIEEAKCLHPAFYVDESYVAVERERLFGSHWFAAAHASELADPGDVKVVSVGETSILLTRDKSGKIHAFYNVCRHRGARICSSSQKGCKQLVCPYHWWAYRLDGSLKATPPAVTTKERKENLGLLPVPGVEIFAGIVFLNQRPNPPPLSDTLGDLPEKLQRYDFDDMSLHKQISYDIKGNWKLIAENFVDFYHINAVHPELAKFSRVDDHVSYQGRGQYIGFATSPLTDSGGPGDSHNFNAFPRLRKRESSSALFFQIFPNISVTIYPHSVYTLMCFPGSTPGSTKEQLTLLMAPGARKQANVPDEFYQKCEDLFGFVKNINDEDIEAIENLQQGLINARGQGIPGEFLPKYDWPVHRFQNMIINGLRGDLLDNSIMPQYDTWFEKEVGASDL